MIILLTHCLERIFNPMRYTDLYWLFSNCIHMRNVNLLVDSVGINSTILNINDTIIRGVARILTRRGESVKIITTLLFSDRFSTNRSRVTQKNMVDKKRL